MKFIIFLEGHKYRTSSYVLSFYTQNVRLTELLEMVLPREIVLITTRCVTLMGHAKVHCDNYSFIISVLI